MKTLTGGRFEVPGRSTDRTPASLVTLLSVGMTVLLFPVAAASAPSFLSAPWKGVVEESALEGVVIGCATLHEISPTWTARTGHVGLGGTAHVAGCSQPSPQSSPESLARGQDGVYLFKPLSVSPSTRWVNLTTQVSLAGSDSFTIPKCPPPSLDAAGNGTEFCEVYAETQVWVDFYLYDTANQSVVISLGSLVGEALGGFFSNITSCTSFVCSSSFYSGSYFGTAPWTNGTSTWHVAIGGGCSWQNFGGWYDQCADNSAVNAPIGFIAGHHYAMLAEVYSISEAAIDASPIGSAVTGSAMASLAGGPSHGVSLTSVTIS